MRAETEVALHGYLGLLESIYGERLRVGTLRVVHRDGEEPFMAVRVRCGDGALEVMWFSHYAQAQTASLKQAQRTTPGSAQRGLSHCCENS